MNPFSRKSSFTKRRYNKATTRRRLRRWRSLNRERARFLRRVGEIRKRLQPQAVDTLGWLEWLERLEFLNYRCHYCGSDKPLEIDHIIPLSQGGHNVIGNVTGACRRCNARKGSLSIEEFLQRLEQQSS